MRGAGLGLEGAVQRRRTPGRSIVESGHVVLGELNGVERWWGVIGVQGKLRGMIYIYMYCKLYLIDM